MSAACDSLLSLKELYFIQIRVLPSKQYQRETVSINNDNMHRQMINIFSFSFARYEKSKNEISMIIEKIMIRHRYFMKEGN